MTSTLVIRSQTATPHSSHPYYLSAIPRATSTLAAQARLHRPVGQDGYWGASQSQGAAGTFAGTSEQSNSGDRTSPDDSWTATNSTPEYHNVLAITPEPDEYCPLSQSFKVAFAPPSTPSDFQNSRPSPESAPRASDSYADDYYSSSHPAPGGIAHPRSFSSPSTSQAPHFAQVADITSTPSHSNMLTAPIQAYPSSVDYSPTQLRGYAENSTPTTFDYTYQSNDMPTLSYPDTTSHANSSFSSAQPQPPYHNQPPSYPQYVSYDDVQSSMPSSMASNQSYEYRAYDTQYAQPIGDNPAPEPAHPSTLPVKTTSSSSPSMDNVSGDLSPLAHTPNSYQTASIQSTQERGRTTEVSPVLSNRSSQISRVGSTESVRRRVGILLQSQYCQQAQQNESTSIPVPRRGSIKASDVRREPRDKLSPTSSDDSEAGDAQRPTISIPKDPVAKYKAAYERVKLQRDFYERAASSLLHQVRMLGGDPMQASNLASKGEELDPKKARILITSLQRELDNSRGKLIETQTQLHALRQSCDESSRSLARGFGGDHYPRDDHDNIPLSAAPTTVYNHFSKR